MLGSVFYHSLTRKYVIAFGNLFNDLYITRIDSTSNVIQTIPVPIQYGPRQKWERLLAEPLQDKKVAIQVPRLGFAFTNFVYDGSRQVSPLNRSTKMIVTDKNLVQHQYSPVPYKITAELYSICKNQDDACQIREQIMPYFTPDLSQTLLLIPELDIRLDTKYNLSGTSFEEQYEGDLLERRTSIDTYTFEIDAWFFGPVSKQSLIKRVQIDSIAVPGVGKINSDDLLKYGRSHRVVVTPGLTPDGKPTSDPNQTIPYQQISPEDDYGFIEQEYFYQDNKKYDPVSGTDKPIK